MGPRAVDDAVDIEDFRAFHSGTKQQYLLCMVAELCDDPAIEALLQSNDDAADGYAWPDGAGCSRFKDY